jgi:RNA recognition motif-containing protein
LQREFSQYGIIESIRVLRNCAFVNYLTIDEATAALIELQGKQLGSMNLKINYGKPRLFDSPDFGSGSFGTSPISPRMMSGATTAIETPGSSYGSLPPAALRPPSLPSGIPPYAAVSPSGKAYYDGGSPDAYRGGAAGSIGSAAHQQHQQHQHQQYSNNGATGATMAYGISSTSPSSANYSWSGSANFTNDVLFYNEDDDGSEEEARCAMCCLGHGHVRLHPCQHQLCHECASAVFKIPSANLFANNASSGMVHTCPSCHKLVKRFEQASNSGFAPINR